ncbi:twin-arginine translocation signal domain-containing protein [Draconibacterium halophilum]|uniref:twin-arginine translocation signal domain-containing protein n=1 Tax=Draconibacterium halophilum TaxID=2706887 RepID=UPI00193F48DC
MLNKSRRNFIKTSALAGTGLFFLSPKIYAWEKMQNVNSMKGKNVLFVYGAGPTMNPKNR